MRRDRRAKTLWINEMNQDELKRGLQWQKLLRDYPRRKNADFSVDEDHNPYVLQDCRTCSGRGNVPEATHDGDWTAHVHVKCPQCNGIGITGEIERYFDNTSQPIDVCCDSNGYLTCPACNWRFAAKDNSVWTGQRHITGGGSKGRICGQRINIKNEP